MSPILETERLVLRPLLHSDLHAIYKLRSDPQVNLFINRPPTVSIDDARAFINKILENSRNDSSYYWAITKKNSDGLIGTICIWNIVKADRKGELGYELLPAEQGQGIMQESMEAVIAFAISEAGLTTLEAFTHRENARSIGLLQKFGFVHAVKRSDEDNINNLIFTLTATSTTN
jgi:ribosomal-protein-alanine N-acetyltransferase